MDSSHSEHESQLAFLLDSKSKDLGGFNVRRVLPVAEKRMVGPFIFFDHMGPAQFQKNHGLDVRPHPHIGLSTLTFLFSGEIVHRDTLGFEQEIRPGEVNWMTAGAGVAHSERSSQEARRHPQSLHGIQTWVALPKDKEEINPSFVHVPSSDIPQFSYQGHKTTLIAGELNGLSSKVPNYSPITYIHFEMQRGSQLDLGKNSHELAAYVVKGEIELNSQVVKPGQMAVLKQQAPLKFKAGDISQVLVLGGEPFLEPRHIWWNFVSSSKERIEQAKSAWLSQKFGKIRGESEFIPLPQS